MKFFPWMPPQELHVKIAEADVCLGIFGMSEKPRESYLEKRFSLLPWENLSLRAIPWPRGKLLETVRTLFYARWEAPMRLPTRFDACKAIPFSGSGSANRGESCSENHCRPEILGSRLVHLIQATLNKKEIERALKRVSVIIPELERQRASRILPRVALPPGVSGF